MPDQEEIQPYDENKSLEEDSPEDALEEYGLEEEDDWAGDPKKMGFLDHLEELRWTIIKPLAVFFITFVVVMVFIRDVSDLLMWPLQQAEQRLGEDGSISTLMTRNPMGVYSAMLQIGFMLSLSTALPFIIYYGAKFVAPALTKKEKRLLLPGSIGVFIFFLLGSSFSFFLLLPASIRITLWFNSLMDYQPLWTPDSYFSFMLWLVLGMGVSFEFPLVVMLLVYLGILTADQLANSRRIMILVFIVAAALLTPPDPFTQLMVAGPMVLLYELSIWVARIMQRKRERELNTILADDD